MKQHALIGCLLAATGCLGVDSEQSPAPTREPCGDGRFEEGEACDGSAPDSPPCRQDCTLDLCGDGVLDEGEACEPALDGAERCADDCTLDRCGDGVVDPGEACDEGPGNGEASPTCTQSCTLPVCGDGIVTPRLGEQCDGTEGCAACRRTSCGVTHVAAATSGFLLVRHDGALFLTGDPSAAGLRVSGEVAPRLVEGAPAFVHLSVRDYAGAGLTAEGRLFTFGPSTHGQRGDGTIGAPPPGAALFHEPLPAERFRDVTTTARAVVALAQDGTLWSFGGDRNAELGPVAAADASQPCPVEGGEEPCRPTPARLEWPGARPVRLAGGSEAVVVIDVEGHAFGFGANAWRQLGRAQAPDCPGEGPGEGCLRTPALLGSARAAAANSMGIVLVDRLGAAVGAGGHTTLGRSGAGDAGREEFAPLGGPAERHVEEVVGADAFFLARTREGGLLGWGENTWRRFDPTDVWERFDPRHVARPGDGTVVGIAAASHGSAVLLEDGRAFGWGALDQDQLGPVEPGRPPEELTDGATSPIELHVCP